MSRRCTPDSTLSDESVILAPVACNSRRAASTKTDFSAGAKLA
jgi:hypothetical protein